MMCKTVTDGDRNNGAITTETWRCAAAGSKEQSKGWQ